MNVIRGLINLGIIFLGLIGKIGIILLSLFALYIGLRATSGIINLLKEEGEIEGETGAQL